MWKYVFRLLRFVFWIWIVITNEFVRNEESPFFGSNRGMTWNDANEYCKANSGQLVTMDTLTKFNFFLEMDMKYHGNLTLVRDISIGLYTTSTDCTNYVWLNGRHMEWSKWGPGEPNRCLDKQCVALRSRLFKTAHCGSVIRKFLCEHASDTLISPSSSWTAAIGIPATTTNSTDATETSSADSLKTTMRAPSKTASPDVSCECCSEENKPSTQPGLTELQDTVTQIKAELSVNKSNTARVRRKKISVYEDRPTCKFMGAVACIVLVVVIGSIVVPDCIKLCRFLSKKGWQHSCGGD